MKNGSAPTSSILKCLRLGVAIHHGALPTAYRKEVERLLREGILKVTISSPTLAQGLNLSATAVIIHSLHPQSASGSRSREFKNVIGRAGRAYVDVEGIVLFPMFDDIARTAQHGKSSSTIWNRGRWKAAWCGLSHHFCSCAWARIGGDLNQLVDYVVNNAEAWTFPEIADEKPEDRERALADWDVISRRSIRRSSA